MPAIVTHDTFGRSALSLIGEAVGTSTDCVEAFLLGNQGPDPLFYVAVDPTLSAWKRMGSRLHRECTDEVLAAMRAAVSILPKEDAPVARAYALGFLCHYLLDAGVHPLVYAQQYALCDAGVEGLTRKVQDSVHATIECEFDEVMMSRHLNTTMAEWSPATHILRASSHVLDVVSSMYVYVCLTVFGCTVPKRLFPQAVRLFRAAETVLVSPAGIKRAALVRTEEALRGVSFLGSLSMHAIPLEESPFENNGHDPWIEPATGRERTECFENLYEASMLRVEECAERFLRADFDAQAAASITCGLNFNGDPIGGALISVVDE